MQLERILERGEKSAEGKFSGIKRANIIHIYFGNRSREHLLLVSSVSPTVRQIRINVPRLLPLAVEYTRKYDRRNITATPGRFNSDVTGLRRRSLPTVDSAK